MATWGRQYAGQKGHEAISRVWANWQAIFHGVFPIVANMVLFLASDDAAMCTANNYMVEAGSI